jgi:hypothetical protein
MTSSRSGQYATGVSIAPTRRTGASRYSNRSLATSAASSAPCGSSPRTSVRAGRGRERRSSRWHLRSRTAAARGPTSQQRASPDASPRGSPSASPDLADSHQQSRGLPARAGRGRGRAPGRGRRGSDPPPRGWSRALAAPGGPLRGVGPLRPRALSGEGCDAVRIACSVASRSGRACLRSTAPGPSRSPLSRSTRDAYVAITGH